MREVIGYKIRTKRIQNGYTLETLSRLMGMTRCNLANIELGKQRMFLDQAIKLGKILCFNISLLAENEGETLAQYRVTELRDKIKELETKMRQMENAS